LIAAVANGCGARTNLGLSSGGSAAAAGSTGAGGSGGAVPDPCESVVCDSPPAPACISATTLRSSAPGVCADGVCSYAPADTLCPNGCSEGKCSGVLNPLRIGAGHKHSCAVNSAGAVKCWGGNEFGQLGNGTTTNSTVPVEVVGLASGVIAMSPSYDRTCIVNSAGAVKCWGENVNGELGNGTTVNSSVPVDVVGLSSGAASVSAGLSHTCALTAAGGVKCWGSNEHGQLGNNTMKSSTVPVDVVGLTSGVISVSAGKRMTCVVTSDGGVKCWGFNDNFGQLGNGSNAASAVPVDVVGLASGVAAVFAGDEAPCAITNGGGVKCWGWNYFGQLGTGSWGKNSLVPVDVVGLSSGVLAVSPGFDHSCAITSAGGVQCWGWNLFGQLGDGPVVNNAVPTDVIGLGSGVLSISAGLEHTCALTSAGTVKCWGDNSSGQLGNSSLKQTDEPVEVVGF
jgi:alpha-tubulin suppressor-like RCC1 family protein